MLLSTTDAMRILGLFQFGDYPPIYVLNVSLLAAISLVAADIGGVSTIAMAGLAYRRFRRDLGLGAIQKSLAESDRMDSTERVRMIADTLPMVASLTGAGRVSVTISLPLGRPFTQIHDAASGKTTLFDDGKIMGAATLRAMVYGDEAVFESYAEFAERLRLPVNPELNDASYFCALPLRVNRNIIGTVMLTRFNDDFIGRQKRHHTESNQLVELRETVRLVVERLSAGLSTLIVEDLHANTAKSKELQSALQQCIGVSSGAEDFLWRYAASLGGILGVQVMIHQQSDLRGKAVAHHGVPSASWSFFVEHPFNLSPEAVPAYGPAVVAFRDGKSSYLKDIREIFDRLHPKSRDILTAMNTGPMAAVSMQTTASQYVVSVLQDRDRPAFESGVDPIIEATEALFVAALEVMSQKTSVMALGQLASRLIGDDEVRDKILAAAKSPDLPTTVGSSRTSFLLLFDLAGSSRLSQDTDVKARAYGDFYDSVNRKVNDALGGLVRKTIGDAVIVTWDGTDIKLEDQPDLLQKLEEVALFADDVARGIGCQGARAILHHGSYFLGLVGTSTFGQIDVIGRGIDEVCKAEGFMKTLRVDNVPVKLAVSSEAVNRLPDLNHAAFLSHGFTDMSGRMEGAICVAFAKVIDITADQEVRRVS
jgi:class 3 adenylate cyclase